MRKRSQWFPGSASTPLASAPGGALVLVLSSESAPAKRHHLGVQPIHVRRGPGRENRTPIIAGNRIEGGVRGHAVEPGAQRRALLHAVAIPPGAKQHLLHRIFGVRQGAEHAVTVDQELVAMTLDVASKSFTIVFRSSAADGSASILTCNQKLISVTFRVFPKV